MSRNKGSLECSPAHSHTCCLSWFCTTKAEFTICSRDCAFRKAENMRYLALYQKSLPTLLVGLSSTLQIPPPNLAQKNPPSQGGGGDRERKISVPSTLVIGSAEHLRLQTPGSGLQHVVWDKPGPLEAPQ